MYLSLCNMFRFRKFKVLRKITVEDGTTDKHPDYRIQVWLILVNSVAIFECFYFLSVQMV